MSVTCNVHSDIVVDAIITCNVHSDIVIHVLSAVNLESLLKAGSVVELDVAEALKLAGLFVMNHPHALGSQLRQEYKRNYMKN